MLKRRQEAPIAADLTRKLVMLSGPRQCGKTTLAGGLARVHGGVHYNWDSPADRLSIQKRLLDEDKAMWVFDEIHKYRRWRGLLKDLTDSYGLRKKILVTGSARLELYGHGGDSLQGRYLAHHLHPLTLSELLGLPFGETTAIPTLAASPGEVGSETMLDLLRFGGFPEPFLSASERQAARWRLNYADRLISEEVSSLEQIREIERLELLYDRLSDIAGGIVSINSLREDLEVAFETVRSWLAILERLDAIFRLSPYGPPRIKSVMKEQKLYFWDWARCTSRAACFENMVAMHLVRTVDWAHDIEGEKLQLRYFRHRAGHEVDFVMLRRGRPWIAVEAKTADNELAPSVRYFVERAQPAYAFQVVLDQPRERRLPDIGASQVRIVSAARFLANLP